MMPARVVLAIGLLCAAVPALGRHAVGEKNIARHSDLAERFDQGRKWAVVIGVNDYVDGGIKDLRYCVADARLVAETLSRQCGYPPDNILLITDDQPRAHQRPMKATLQQQVSEWLKFAEPGDTVLVFFSGHGFLDDRGEIFLATQDTQLDHLRLTSLPKNELRGMLDHCKAAQKLLVLDCCHAGGEKGSEKPGLSSGEIGAAFREAKGLLTLASCGKEEESREWDEKGQGLFTYFLADGLRGRADRDRDGIVTSDELYDYTLGEVAKTARNRFGATQQPRRIIGEDVIGSFALARTAASEVRRQITGTFTLREGNLQGPLVPGAKLELLYRESPQADAMVLGRAASDAAGHVAITAWLDANQQAKGDFFVLVNSARASKTWALPDFPKSHEWNLVLPSPAPPKLITNSIGIKMVLTPSGEFLMGSSESPSESARAFARYGAKPENFLDEQPRLRVRISNPFYLGRHEVTVGQFRQFVGDHRYTTEAERDGKGGWGWNAREGKIEGPKPKYNWRNTGILQDDNHPVVNVTWNDAVEFCKWLSRKEGRTYRLPTEAEWEYACRAGTSTRWWSGDDESRLVESANIADAAARRQWNAQYAIAGNDGYAFTSPVGSFRSNPNGLYDVHGNVWEWCGDWYGESSYVTSGAIDPAGPSGGRYRVLRGGSWLDLPWYSRSADRGRASPESRDLNFGFRVVLIDRSLSQRVYTAPATHATVGSAAALGPPAGVPRRG